MSFSRNKKLAIASVGVGLVVIASVFGGVSSVTGSSETLAVESESHELASTNIDKTTYLVKVEGNAGARSRTFNTLEAAAAAENGAVGDNLGGGWHSVEFDSDVDPAQAMEMLSVRGVTAVEPNVEFQTLGPGETAPKYRSQFYLNQASNHDVDAPEAWRAGAAGSATVKVAVIDTGVQTTHPDLVNTTVAAYSATGAGATTPKYSHGTMVAGLIGASGAKGITGVAPGVKIIPIRVDDAAGVMTGDAVIKGINHAITQKANVINISLGTKTNSAAVYDAILRANNAGILIVAAAGNETTNIDYSPSYPAAYNVPMVLSVGASSRYGSIAGFSNYGVKNVDVAAPGEETLTTSLNGIWESPDGTSFSSPLTAGAAALVKSKYPLASMYSIKQHLLKTAKPDPGWAGKSVTGDVVSVGNAIKTAPAAVAQPVVGGGPVNPVEPVTPVQPVNPENPNNTVGGGPTPPTTSGVATLEKPVSNTIIDGRWDSFSWSFPYEWDIANLQIERGSAPDRDLLAPTRYGQVYGREGAYRSSYWYDGQMPSGTYWWRVVTVPEDNPNGQLVPSPHANFRVPTALEVAVGVGRLRMPASRSRVVRSKLRVAPQLRTNDTGAKVQVYLYDGKKIVWRSKVKRIGVKPGVITTVSFSGSPKVKRNGRKRLMVKVTSSSGAVVKKSAVLR